MNSYFESMDLTEDYKLNIVLDYNYYNTGNFKDLLHANIDSDTIKTIKEYKDYTNYNDFYKTYSDSLKFATAKSIEDSYYDIFGTKLIKYMFIYMYQHLMVKIKCIQA